MRYTHLKWSVLCNEEGGDAESVQGGVLKTSGAKESVNHSGMIFRYFLALLQQR